MYKLKFILIFFLLLIIKQNSLSQNLFINKVMCEGTNKNAFTRVEAPTLFLDREYLNKTTTSDFIVEYEGASSSAETAFNYATRIWSYLLSATRPIRIKVIFESFTPGSTTLGSTQIVTYRNNFTNAPSSNIQYPMALVKQVNPGIDYDNLDMTIKFNAFAPWNFNTDGVPIENMYDFVSVALHEIAHGLGFSASFTYESGLGYFGLSGFPINTTGNFPVIYDKYCVSGSTQLITKSHSELGSLLTNENVSFNGPNAKIANKNINPKLYAPNTWDDGSSIYHLDEQTFLAGNSNSLMSPQIDMAEVNHNPGEITLAILKDLGWQVNRMVSFIEPSAMIVIVRGQSFTIKWYDNISSIGDWINLELYKMVDGQSLFQGIVGSRVSSDPGSSNQFIWNIPTTIEPGLYFIKAVGYNIAVAYGKTNIFIISDFPQPPMFSPAGGSYSDNQNIYLSTSTTGAIIRYTLDNSEPNQSSMLYNQPIYVDRSLTIKAKSFLTLPNGIVKESNTSIATYYIKTNSFSVDIACITGNVFQLGSGYGGNVGWMNLGKTGSYIYRSWIKIENLRQKIPANSIIQSAQFLITFTTDRDVNIKFKEFNFGSNSWLTWQNIGNSTTIKEIPANSKIFNIEPLATKIQNIINGTSSDVLNIGLQNSDETNAYNYLQYPYEKSTLRVYFRGNVEVSQLDMNDEPYGQVGMWQNNVWNNLNVPATLFIPQRSNITLKSDQNYKQLTSEKYHSWLQQTDVINFKSFQIKSGENKFTSKFGESYNTPILKNFFEGIEGLNPPNDSLEFKDPWLIDFNEHPFGMRNQGLSAPFKKLPSPINFNSMDFANYKGVFLNQGITPQGQWQPPYYSVKSDAVQDIYLQHTGRTHKFYFQGWSATPQGSAEFQNANNNETGVVFKDANVTVSANLKRSLLSNSANVM